MMMRAASLWAKCRREQAAGAVRAAAPLLGRCNLVSAGRKRRLCWWVGQVNGRAIVEVRGRDAARFLQGLTTNDLLALLPRLSPSPSPSPPPPPAPSSEVVARATGSSRYTAFLTPTGRFLADALVSLSSYNPSLAPSQGRQLQDSDVMSAPRGGGTPDHHPGVCDPEQQSFLVECDARAAPVLVSHLRRYRLRAQVDIVPPAQQADGGWTVGALLTRSSLEEGVEDTSEALLQRLRAQAPTLPCFVDPRTAAMGVRVYYRRASGFVPPLDFTEATAAEYRLYRILNAVPEGIDELEPNVALPLECNLDALNGVSYTKGCYLGQELTSRVHHTGVIRKRLVPVICFSPDDEARERDLGVAQRLLDYSHQRGALEGDRLLPLALSALPSLTTTNMEPCKIELYATGASSGQRPVGRLCGGIENGLGFALLRLDHTSATLTLSPSTGAAPLFAKPLWPPPYPLPQH